jgi:hypothetical protein
VLALILKVNENQNKTRGETGIRNQTTTVDEITDDLRHLQDSDGDIGEILYRKVDSILLNKMYFSSQAILALKILLNINHLSIYGQ